MLRSIKKIYGDRLHALDGDIGHVKDFYFDDRQWTVRYLVVETAPWIPDRAVLISPNALRGLTHEGNIVPVNLTRKQVDDSPLMETHQPVSRLYEEQYHTYYGWPNYWKGDGMWGISDIPLLPGELSPSNQPPVTDEARQNGVDSHLRSTQVVTGYKVLSGEETVGHIHDFLVDDKTWAICHMVIDTGFWLTGKKILLSPGEVNRISWDSSKVFVNVSKDAIIHRTPYEADAVAQSEGPSLPVTVQ